MHLLTGLIRIIFANFLASLYRMTGRHWIGQSAVRLCCNAFISGAGIDDAAIEVIKGMGADGIRFLKGESNRRGKQVVASMMLKIMGVAGDD